MHCMHLPIFVKTFRSTPFYNNAQLIKCDRNLLVKGVGMQM